MGPETKTRPKKTSHKKQICKDEIDSIVARRTFEPMSKPAVGCRFLRFTRPGERAVGRLGYPIKNFRQGTSYPLELDDGEIVEFVGNRLLHQQIRKGELCGRRIEIVYQGKEFLWGWHYRKIYRLYDIGDKLVFSKAQWAKILKAAERKKDGR